ncbi:class I SAM-dependent methyltransferase [Microbispora sp. NPDC049125]|uniref:class I SAM-dependent methyltransferase n=1 Tax=Microbispora sp. NPDC049125 TaxID=3154929 RepID=UPI0034651F40
MRNIVNTEQGVAWNGYDGVHWADNAERWNTVVGEINEELFAAAAIEAGARVLDIGCGAGQTTRLAARKAEDGHATGIDLSAPMLARARATAIEQGIVNVLFEQGDAQVHPFPAGEFDVAISRGGVMFFNDPVAAFANIGCALRPGGRLAFVCPQEMAANEWFVVQMSALLGHEPRPAAGARGMFSLADPERIHDVLTEAGFGDVTAEPAVTRMVYGSDAADAAEFYLSTGPVRFHLREAGQSDVDQARERVTAALRPYERGGVVGLRASWWVVNATKR